MITIDEIKDTLRKKFINNYQSITIVSKRTDNKSKISMLESDFKVFNYDDGILKITNNSKNQEPMCAVDAIDIQKDTIYFIEFKDGTVFNAKPKDKYQLRLKMIESIFQLLDVLDIPLAQFKNFLDLKKVFILVYNANKNPITEQQITQENIKKSSSSQYIKQYIFEKSGKEFIRYGLEEFTKYFNEVHTYCQQDFEEYIKF